MSTFETKRRSVAKALSWRFLATIITTVVTFVLTRKLNFALEVGLLDTGIKLLVYFGHERLWNQISYGRVTAPDYEV